MTEINKNKPVMVTGATGYVAGWIVKKLLDEGYTVHAAVRNPDDKEKLKYLDEIALNAKGDIVYFKSDLLSPGSYDEAMKDCELVFHTASPFTSKIKDPQKDLVDPALLGTQNVLDSVNRTESVKRVVLTSSCVAIIGDAKDCQAYPNGTATEEHWNTTSTLHHQPYAYSKTVAEKKAWEINEQQNRWDLVVINPSFVLGPGINPYATSESFNIMKQLGDGTMKSGIPEYYIGTVDVRDLAEAHFQAGFNPDAKGRHIVSAENTSILNLAKYLQNKFGNAYPFPKKVLPKFLIWIMAPMIGLTRKIVKQNIGYEWKVDNSKGIRELGLKYLPTEKTVVDLFQQMIDNGYFKK
ncbi:MAG: NAD-dependent epimerase/dehydratase family protein [Bacteroidales bacterium]|nr:NAD-dependent epimerase/dehydratase family protein [Bacteroidales bacterium]